jgi:hypothetical protein
MVAGRMLLGAWPAPATLFLVSMLAVMPGPLATAWAADTAARPAAIAARYLRTGDAALGDGVRIRERQAGLRAWSAERSLQGPMVPGSLLRLGLDYAYTRFAFEGLTTRPRDLHHLHLPVSWRDRDDRWLLVATPVVATSSNVFKDLPNRGGSDDVDLHLRLQVDRWRTAGTGWRLALVRDNAFGKPQVYPEAAFLWRRPAAAIELGLPSSRVRWQARRDLAIGAAVFPAGASWHVVSDERGGAEFDYRARAWRAALTADWRPWRGLMASAHAGMAFRRHYRFEDDTGATIDRDAGSARYWQLMLQWAWPG